MIADRSVKLLVRFALATRPKRRLPLPFTHNRLNRGGFESSTTSIPPLAERVWALTRRAPTRLLRFVRPIPSCLLSQAADNTRS